MNNREELLRWLKDAKASLEAAYRNYEAEDFRVAIQQAQLCIEFSAKGIIAYFEEPQWTHNPAQQLHELLRSYPKIFSNMEDLIKKLADHAEYAAPWHGLSTYGKETEQGWVPAVDICDKETAEELFKKAEEAFHIAKNIKENLLGHFKISQGIA
jgi:HEPN domain-containing protein